MSDFLKSFVPYLWSLGTLLVSFLVVAVIAKRKRRGRIPVSEKMLRPPGESTRVRLEKLDENILYVVSVFLTASVIASIFFHVAYDLRKFAWWFPAIFAVFGLCLVISSISFLTTHGSKYANYILGFHGERVVGEHLNRLMLDGCEVFHDLVVDDKWNIDHIIVSPRGVFVIETKTRRKPIGDNGHKVIFNGTDLEFSTWKDQHGLKQAADNARWVADFLTKSTGERVNATPILTLPGWWVERKGKGTVNVLNPKQIREVVIDNRLPLLDEKQRRRICFQLEQKCRDVEL